MTLTCQRHAVVVVTKMTSEYYPRVLIAEASEIKNRYIYDEEIFGNEDFTYLWAIPSLDDPMWINPDITPLPKGDDKILAHIIMPYNGFDIIKNMQGGEYYESIFNTFREYGPKYHIPIKAITHYIILELPEEK